MSFIFVGTATGGTILCSYVEIIYSALPIPMGSVLNPGENLAPIRVGDFEGHDGYNLFVISQRPPGFGVRDPSQAATGVPEALKSTDLPILPLRGTE